jgi:hypothetical protein
MKQIRASAKEIILQEVEHIFGRKVVSSGDCKALSDEIYSRTNHQLNQNTLRRFFNLVKADYPPSHSTLLILSKYCGFESVEDIHRNKTIQNTDNELINPDTILHFFVSVFRQTDKIEPYETVFLNMVVQTIKFLNANKFLTDKFQRLISKTSSGNSYYFEQLVNVDNLNSFYGNGLRYYVKQKGTPEAEIFTASLFVFRYWLSGEDEKLVRISAKLLPFVNTGNMHPCMTARQFAAILFFHDVSKSDSEAIRNQIQKYYVELEAEATNRKFINHFIYVISEALMLTGYPEEALLYLKKISILQDDQKNNYNPFDYSQVFSLTEAYSLYNIGEYKHAKSIVNDIKSSEFPFLNKKLSGILYLSLLQKMKPKSKSVQYNQQLITWINETGFKRLLTI